jgi:two-component system, OmpR family, phosphate regulon response regulator PhoB
MSRGARILVVEDDENLRVGLQDNLEEEGYRVEIAADAAATRRILSRQRDDGGEDELELIILDVMLPDTDGYELCRELRANGDRTKVLMLTARTLEQDIVRGFDAGADDYVAKPYRIAELLARVRALVRRSGDLRAEDTRRVGDYRIDTESRVVHHIDGSRVELTRTEFDLLACFVDRAGRALHRQQILDAVWGADVIVDGRTVDNFVSSLKKKLQWSPDANWRVTTIRGVGYRFESESADRNRR